MRDLFESFGMGDPYDKSNAAPLQLVRTSGNAGGKTIVLRGNVSRDVKDWLEERGF